MRPALTFLFLHLFVLSFTQTKIAGDDFVQQLMAKQKAAIGKPFPEFSAKSGDSLMTKQAFKAKAVFVNFWFEACAPCVAEFDGLNELYNKAKDKPDFLFVSFTFETPEKCKEVQSKYGLQYPIISLSREDCRRLSHDLGYPTNMIVDKAGNISYLTFGGSTNKKEAAEILMKQYYPKILEALK